MVRIFGTRYILKHLNSCIVHNKSFSTIRFGDACLFILSSTFCRQFEKGKGKISNKIFDGLNIPPNKRLEIVQDLVKYANQADYVDAQSAVLVEIPKFLPIMEEFIKSGNTNFGQVWERLCLKTKGQGRGVGNVMSRWREIYKESGITNNSFCSPHLHSFSIIDGEYNLFDIMKNRNIFCISNNIEVCDRLQKKSGAKNIDYFRVVRRGSKKHYPLYYQNVMDIISKKAIKYDLFLIGAGLLGKIYCGYVKECGGRSFDAGRLFDVWKGKNIRSIPARFLVMNKQKMLCERKKNKNGRVW